VSITNNGTTAGTTPFSVYLSTDATIDGTDILVYTGTSQSIAASTTGNETVTCTAPPTIGGPYYAGLLIAPGNTAAGSSAEVTVVHQYTAQAVSIPGSVPLNVAQEDSLNVSRSIRNNLSLAGTTNYAYYLSTDGNITTGDTLIFSGTSGTIGGGATDTLTDTVNVPQSMAPGTYYLGLLISAGNAVPTSGAHVAVVLTADVLFVGAPSAPLYVAPSTTFQVTRTIRNNSNSAQNVNYDIRLSTNTGITTGDPLVLNQTDSIAPNTTDTRTVTCTAPTGAGGWYYTGIYHTSFGTAASANQEVLVTSNTTPSALSVLVPGAVVSVLPGGTFQATRSIMNPNAGAMTTYYALYLSSDTTIDFTDTRVYYGSVSIGAGATDTATITTAVPLWAAPGNYYVGLLVDAGNTVATVNQDVTVTGTANLQAASAGVPNAPLTVNVNGTFSVDYSITNSGTAGGTAPITIYLSTDATIDTSDIQVYAGMSGAIAAGGSENGTLACTAPAIAGGPYYVGLYLGSANTAASSTTEVTVVDAVVPAAQSITVTGAPVTVAAGSTFQISRTIQNIGSIAGTVGYQIYLSTDATIDSSDILVYSGTTASIAVAGSDTQTDTVTALSAGGPYYVGLYIAPSNWAVTAAADVTVTAGFDPLAQSVTVTNPTVQLNQDGGSFDVIRTIQNIGTVAGAADFMIVLSTDTTIDASDLVVLSSTTASIVASTSDTVTETCTVPAGSTPGNYYVGLLIYAGNTAATANRDVSISSAQPNLFTSAVSVTNPPARIPQGGTFDVTRSIQNTGDGTGAVNYEIYLSTDNTITTADDQVFSGVSGNIVPGGMDTATVTCTVPAALAADTDYYVGLYISATDTMVALNMVHVLLSTVRFDAVEVTVPTGVTYLPGESVGVLVKVRNSGGAAGTADYTVYLSNDATIDTSDLQASLVTTASLAADGGEEVAMITFTIPDTGAGPYYVGIYITSTNVGTQTAVSADTIQIDSPPPPPSDDDGGGCGCSAPGGNGNPMAYLPLLLVAGLYLALRRYIRKAFEPSR
jgi:uncharacterized membrane protein